MNHPVQETPESLEARQKQAPLDPEAQNGEALYRAIVNTIPDGITLIEQGRVTFTSDRACEIFGYPRQQYVTMSELDFAAPEERERLKTSIEESLQLGRFPDELEFWIVRPDGTRCCVHNQYSSLYAEEGGEKRLVITRDITTRKRAEEALRESEECYRALFDSIPVGLYRTTPDGQILDANPALVEMLGYPDRETLLATNAARTFVDPKDRSREQELLDKIGVLSDVELQLRRFDGSVIWVRDSVRSVRHDLEGVLYYDGSLVDITERKQAEKYLLRAERLAAMGQISATLAHEVKNPLQAIHSNLELARDYSLDPDEREECLQVCSREVEQLIEITARMLSFSRGERYTMRPVSLQEIWRQAMVLLIKPLEGASVQIQADLPEDLPPVLGIADQLHQVLLNLVINAIEVMPDGGLIRAAARIEGEQLSLSLVNNGPPIPEEHIEHIFDPFFTTKPDGSGLGLFISYNIIEQHGGRLRVENLSYEAGVCFTLTLPVAAVQDGSGRPQAPGESLSSGQNSKDIRANNPALAAGRFGR